VKEEVVYQYVWLSAPESASESGRRGIEQVADLVVQVSQADPYVGLPPESSADDVEALRTRLQSVLASGRAHVLVIRDEPGEAVGCVVLARSATPNQAHIAELTTGVIHPAHRGRGVVSRAFTEIAELCRQVGVELLRLDVRAGIPAERLWRRYGFQEYGRLADYGRIDGTPYSGVFLAQPVEELIARISEPLSTVSQEA
jgi:ribosomal protein S18 acetylase RimI-like enzyme